VTSVRERTREVGPGVPAGARQPTSQSVCQPPRAGETPGLADALREQSLRDLADASEVEPSEWAKRGWAERGVEAIGWAARKVL
jgi:hypothetical protein